LLRQTKRSCLTSASIRVHPWFKTRPLQRGVAAFLSTDANDFDELVHPDFAVADLAGAAAFHDRVDRLRGHVVTDGNFDFHLGNKIDRVFAAAVDFGVPLLATEALHFG